MKIPSPVVSLLVATVCCTHGLAATVIDIGSDPSDYELWDTLFVAQYAYSAAGYVTDPQPVTGRNAVFVFPLPALQQGQYIDTARLSFTYFRSDPDIGSFQLMNADLAGIGFSTTTAPILMYSESDVQESGAIRLQNNIITPFSPEPGRVTLQIDPLRDYIQSFYDTNSAYTGGSYVFLRINQDKRPPPLNPLRYYRIGMSELETPQSAPMLTLTIVPEPNAALLVVLGSIIACRRRSSPPSTRVRFQQ